MKITEKLTRRLVASIMTDAIVILDEEDTLAKAASRMDECGASSVLVMRGEDIAGILTEHDLVRQLGMGINLEQAISSQMTRQVVSIAAGAEIHEAFQAMLAHGIHHLVVMNEHEKPSP